MGNDSFILRWLLNSIMDDELNILIKTWKLIFYSRTSEENLEVSWDERREMLEGNLRLWESDNFYVQEYRSK